LRPTMTALLAFVLLSTAAHAQDSTGTIADSLLSSTPSSIGKTPQWVYDHYGRPNAVFQENLCCAFHGYSFDVLIHSYDVLEGGVVAFIYARPVNSNTWTVVGLTYDSWTSTQDKALTDFFKNGAPRSDRIYTCLDKDFYHHSEGQLWSPSIYALWNSPGGRTIYAKYTITGDLPRSYDPALGRDVPTIPSHLDNLPLVQMGYFQSMVKVMDLHLIQNDDDFSITSLYKDCKKG
jgi:hypothetical protein